MHNFKQPRGYVNKNLEGKQGGQQRNESDYSSIDLQIVISQLTLNALR
jgi:hypothetical protein